MVTICCDGFKGDARITSVRRDCWISLARLVWIHFYLIIISFFCIEKVMNLGKSKIHDFFLSIIFLSWQDLSLSNDKIKISKNIEGKGNRIWKFNPCFLGVKFSGLALRRGRFYTSGGKCWCLLLYINYRKMVLRTCRQDRKILPVDGVQAAIRWSWWDES